MNPQQVFCPNTDCPAKGQQDRGNIEVHSRVEKRYICTVCDKTFSATKGTLFYRLRTDPEIVVTGEERLLMIILSLPSQAESTSHP